MADGWRIRYVMLCVLFSLTAYGKTLMIIGDELSLSSGIEAHNSWVKLLKDHDKTWRIINVSVAGMTAKQSLQLAPAYLKHYRPDRLLIALDYQQAKQHKIKPNIPALRQLIHHAHAIPSIFIIPPCLPPWMLHAKQTNHDIMKTYQTVSEMPHVSLLPAWLLTLKPSDFDDNLQRLSPEGHQHLFRYAMQHVLSAY